MSQNNQPQLQSSLGDLKSSKTSEDRTWNRGSLALGKVLKVHPKRYTADVQLYKTNDTFVSFKEDEGRFSCRIGVSSAGFDTKYNKPYGSIIPIQKGNIVLVGFLRNMKGKPVILRVFHNTSEDDGQNNLKNILESEYKNLGESEINRYLDITPLQDFFSLDSNGDLELSSHTKSFVVFKDIAMDDEEYDYEDLSVRDATGKVTTIDEKYSRPKKFMAVFRDSFSDSLTNWLKVIIDPLKTSIRLAKLQRTGKVSLIEIDSEGAIRLRRHLDTKSLDRSDSKNYTEICLTASGDIEVTVKGNKLSALTIGSEGTTLNTEGTMKISGSSKVHLESSEIELSGDSSITGTLKVNGKRVAVEGDKTADGDTIQ